jgi:hypothetical protein
MSGFCDRWLIPDDQYHPEFEGKRVAALPVMAMLFGCSRAFVAFLTEHERLLTNLQYIHDNHAPFTWWSLLRELASQCGLDIAVIRHMKGKHAARAGRERAVDLSYRAVNKKIHFEPVASRHFSIMCAADVQAFVMQSISEALCVPPSLLTEESHGHVVPQPEQTCEAAPA